MSLITLILGILIGVLAGIMLTIFAIQNILHSNPQTFNRITVENPFMNPVNTVGEILRNSFNFNQTSNGKDN